MEVVNKKPLSKKNVSTPISPAKRDILFRCLNHCAEKKDEKKNENIILLTSDSDGDDVLVVPSTDEKFGDIKQNTEEKVSEISEEPAGKPNVSEKKAGFLNRLCNNRLRLRKKLTIQEKL